MNYISIDKLPKYRRELNLELQDFIENLITEERKFVLKNTLEKRTNHLALVAEGLLDEHNIHAIIRTSECFGMQDFYNIAFDGALKKNKSITRGAFQWTHIHEYESKEHQIIKCMDDLRQKGYKVYATSSHLKSNFTPQSIPIDHKLAIILGNEHLGVSNEAIEYADGTIEIPMYGFTESFNVSVAAALICQPIIERIRSEIKHWNLSSEAKKNLYYEWLWHSIKHPDKVYNDWINHYKI